MSGSERPSSISRWKRVLLGFLSVLVAGPQETAEPMGQGHEARDRERRRLSFSDRSGDRRR